MDLHAVQLVVQQIHNKSNKTSEVEFELYLIRPAVPFTPHVSINEVSCLFTVIFNESKKHKAYSSSFIV